MTAIPLTDTVSVSAQISLDDLAQAAASGVTTVISNRPDGEEPGQPSFAEVKAAAEAVGMTAHHIPMLSGQMPDDATIAAHAAAIDGAEGSVLAFCRSGMRSTMLWALSQAGTEAPETLIATAGRAGYDISGMAPALAARSGR